MNKIMPMMEARKNLTSLPELLVRDGEIDIAEITRRGKPVLAVMPWELYEAIQETLEVLGDEKLITQLRQSIKELEEGLLIPWEQAKAGFGQ